MSNGDVFYNNEHLRTIFICAVRYCLGRRTYMPGLVTDWIMHNCDGKLELKDIVVMLNDIQEQREFGERMGIQSLGESCDVNQWTKFEAWLFEQKRRVENNENKA